MLQQINYEFLDAEGQEVPYSKNVVDILSSLVHSEKRASGSRSGVEHEAWSSNGKRHVLRTSCEDNK